MEGFNYVLQRFQQLSFAAVNDPYGYVCANYQNYIMMLKQDKKGKERNKLVISKLRTGLAHCCIWDRDDISDHFVEVYNYMNNLKTDIK